MIRPLVCAAVAFVGFALTAALSSAATVAVTAVADSRIDALQPGTSFPTGSLYASKEGATDTTATMLTKFYAQFDLPSGLTGATMATVSNVQLKLARTGPNLSLTYYIYGVKDGLDTASADSYTWNSGVGYDPTHTLVKFLGADDYSYYTDPAKGAIVGVIDTATPGAGPFDFTSTPQSPTFAAALKSLILADTDGRITFYVGIRQPFGATDAANTFASIETLTAAGPQLTFTYTVPEPATCGLVACGLIAVAGLRRRTR